MTLDVLYERGTQQVSCETGGQEEEEKKGEMMMKRKKKEKDRMRWYFRPCWAPPRSPLLLLLCKTRPIERERGGAAGRFFVINSNRSRPLLYEKRKFTLKECSFSLSLPSTLVFPPSLHNTNLFSFFFNQKRIKNGKGHDYTLPDLDCTCIYFIINSFWLMAWYRAKNFFKIKIHFLFYF